MGRPEEIAPGAQAFIRAVSDFIFVDDAPAPSDVIFVPGSAYPEHALRAAELYGQGMAEWVLPSGRYSLKADGFPGVPEAWRARYPGRYETEWAFLRDVLTGAGVPERAILREDQARYTWDNALRSRAVTDAMGLTVRQALLCVKPSHARRAQLYYQAAYPEARILVCPASLPGRNRDDWYRSAAGRAKVLGEVRRLGGQISEVFERMLPPDETSDL